MDSHIHEQQLHVWTFQWKENSSLKSPLIFFILRNDCLSSPFSSSIRKMEESQTNELFPNEPPHTHTHTHTHWSAARRPVSWWTVLYWYEVLIWNLWVNHQCSANDKRVHRHTKSFPNHCKESISFYCPARKQKHNRVYDLKTLFKCVTMSEGICDSYWAHKWVIYSVINGWADGNITQWSILTLSSNNLWDGECLFYFRTAERKSSEKLISIHIHLGSMQRKPVYKVTYWMLCLYS